MCESRVAAFGALIKAGLLMGVGARYGSGCPRGHGVCGLARLSPRQAAMPARMQIQKK